MKEKGFSLIELLIVIAILGILAAIAFPVYTGYIRSSARSEAKANLETLRLLEEQYFAERGQYAPAGAALGTKMYYKVGDTGINTNLPGFTPGDASSLNFDYEIEITAVSGGRTTAFIARATGKAGTKVEGDTLTINNTNTKTGPW